MAKLTKEQKQKALIKWAKEVLAWYNQYFGATKAAESGTPPPPPKPPELP
jgi:hypothetical protein